MCMWLAACVCVCVFVCFRNTPLRVIPKDDSERKAIVSAVQTNMMFNHLDSDQLRVIVGDSLMPVSALVSVCGRGDTHHTKHIILSLLLSVSLFAFLR